MARKKASSLEISDIRVKYDKNDGSLRITSKDPDLKGKPFSLTVTGNSPTAETLFELMRAHNLVEDPEIPTKLTLQGREELEALYDPAKPLQFVLGETYGGELTTVDLSNKPHMLISGAAGAGKSVLLRSLAKQIELRDDFHLTVFDPTDVEWKQEDLRPQDRVLRSNQALAEELEKLDDELQYRHYKMKEEAVNDVALVKHRLPYKVLVLDSASRFLSGDGIDATDGVAVAKHELAKQRLLKILRSGRSAGIHVIISIQYFNFELLYGEAVASVVIRIAMGSNSYMASAAFLGGKPAYGQGVLRDKGRGVLSVRGEQTPFQAYYVPGELKQESGDRLD